MAEIKPKGIIVHSMAEKLDTPVGVMGAHDFLKSINLSVHGFIHPDGRYEKMIESPNPLFSKISLYLLRSVVSVTCATCAISF